VTYLSRLYLNGRNRFVRQDVADCREMHRTVMRGFPQAPVGTAAGDTFGVMYRIEQDSRGRIRLLVQSYHAPEWSQLAKIEGYLDPDVRSDNPAVKDVGELYAGLQAGQPLRFRLRANPTKRVGKSGEAGQVGKRVDLRREEDQLTWLARKGEAGGFVLASVGSAPSTPNVRTIPEDVVAGRRRQEGKRMTFGSVLFEGLLHVTDPDRFRETLREGIGSGKAYGFGLLSIAPP
jgi:CRISPR system Cascade subunit CasE